MLGQDVQLHGLPYFFTDQYDLGMEYIGYVEPRRHARVVIRGDLDEARVRGVLAAADGRVGPG